MARLTLEVSDDVDALLRDLARAEKIDKYEVIRRALALYQYVHREAVEQKHKDPPPPSGPAADRTANASVSDLSRVAIELRIGLMLQALQRDLARLRPELLLLYCHGTWESSLLFEDSRGVAEYVSGARVFGLLNPRPRVLDTHVPNVEHNNSTKFYFMCTFNKLPAPAYSLPLVGGREPAPAKAGGGG
jgi:hypothetical protein